MEWVMNREKLTAEKQELEALLASGKFDVTEEEILQQQGLDKNAEIAQKEYDEARREYSTLPEHDRIKEIDATISEKINTSVKLNFLWHHNAGTTRDEIADLNEEKAALSGRLAKLKKQVEGKKKVMQDAIAEAIAFRDAKESGRSEEIKRRLTAISAALGESSSLQMGEYALAGTRDAINWRVLEINGSEALLITERAIDVMPFNSKYGDTSWSACSLRKWLNETFYNSFFTPTERERIIKSHLEPEKNTEYDTDPGNATDDYIFLLSMSEAEKYFKSAEDRSCEATEHAKDNKAYVNHENGKSWWWLRTPGYGAAHAAIVLSGGTVYADGAVADDRTGAIRPAMRVNLD